MHPIVLAKKGVMGGVLHMVKWGCICIFDQAGLCIAQTSCVSHFKPQYYTFYISGLCTAQVRKMIPVVPTAIPGMLWIFEKLGSAEFR